MNPRAAPARIAVSGDLRVLVTAPDGSTASLQVRDDGDELIVEVDRPLVVLRALPRSTDVLGPHRPADPVEVLRGAVRSAPSIRVRTRRLTLVTIRLGVVRPGPVVTAAAGATAAVVVGVGAGAVRRVLARP